MFIELHVNSEGEKVFVSVDSIASFSKRAGYEGTFISLSELGCFVVETPEEIICMIDELRAQKINSDSERVIGMLKAVLDRGAK